MFGKVLNAPLVLSTPSNYFWVQNNKNLPISISFATAFHVLVTTYFSLHPLSCLPNSTGYCFTCSHNIPCSCLSSSTGYCFTCSHNIPCSCKESTASCQHLFLCFIFICKIVAANDSAFNYLSVFSEVFLFHEITCLDHIIS